MFNLAVLSGLYRKAGDDKAEIYLESTSLKLQFDNLNKYEKYCFLLETFWTKFDFMELIRWEQIHWNSLPQQSQNQNRDMNS
jgi:hypothetical protein